MPARLPLEAMREAELAIKNAQEVREYHRKRTLRKDRQRQQDIKHAIERLKKAMVPLRSERGKFPYGPQTDVAARNRQKIIDTSEALQSERRKLWKMLNTPKRKKKARK